jgi:hypothetical protein
MTESVQVAVIGALALVLVAIVTTLVPLLISTRRTLGVVAKDAAETRWQVKNGHPLNMREEGDVRHEENRADLTEVKRLIRAQSRTMGRRFRSIEKRLDIVEDTVPKTSPSKGKP